MKNKEVIAWQNLQISALNTVAEDYSKFIRKLGKENAELKAQIEKMKCCENCAWWYKLPNGQRDCAETCENRDNWSLRK